MDVVDVAEYVVKECTHLKLAGLMTIGSPDASRANESNQNPDFKVITI